MTATSGPHIGYLVQQFPPEIGAGPARVGELGLRWLAAGARLSVYTAMPNRPAGRIYPKFRGKLFSREAWKGVDVHRSWLYASPKHGFARTLVNNLSFMGTSALNAAVRAERPDVLIASSPPFFVHLAGEALRRRWRVPLVLEVRDLWPDYLVGMGALRNPRLIRALFRLERALLLRAAHVVVVTESFRERIIEKGVPAERISVIPNGVDTEFYYRSGDEPFPVEAPPAGDQAFRVGYLGNFGASQDLPALVAAAKLLEREDPAIRMMLVGDGTEKERVLRAAAEAGASNLSIHPPIAKEHTRAFYNGCDVCLVPLANVPVLQETIPSKIFEVMACERPVVASLAGEGGAIVEGSGGGLVARPGDPRSIADAILRLKALPEADQAVIGQRGRCFVEQHYGRDALAARYLEILRAVAVRTEAPLANRTTSNGE